MGLSHSDRELTRIVAALRGDDALIHLVELAHSIGFETPIQLLVDGAMLEGNITSEAEFGASLDANLLEGVERLSVNLQGDDVEPQESAIAGLTTAIREALRDALSGAASFEKRVRRRLETAEKTREQALHRSGGERIVLSELPSGLARRYLLNVAPPRTLALARARIVQPQGDAKGLGLIHVQIDRITAWWPHPEMAGAQVNVDFGAEEAALAEGERPTEGAPAQPGDESRAPGRE